MKCENCLHYEACNRWTTINYSPAESLDCFDNIDDWIPVSQRLQINVKHGKWVDTGIRDYCCSLCNAEAPNDGYDNGANYCYNCGARMEGDEK